MQEGDFESVYVGSSALGSRTAAEQEHHRPRREDTIRVSFFLSVAQSDENDYLCADKTKPDCFYTETKRKNNLIKYIMFQNISIRLI